MSKFNLPAIIKEVFEKYPESKDRDYILMKHVYKSIKPKVEMLTLSYFWELIGTGELPSPESIRRTRQKIQEENEALRGEYHGERQKKGKEISQTITLDGDQALMRLQ